MLLLVAALFAVWYFFFAQRWMAEDDTGIRDASPSPAAKESKAIHKEPDLPPTPPAVSMEEDPGGPFIAEARGMMERGEWAAAREKAFDALNIAQHPDIRRKAEDFLSDIHIRLALSPMPMKEKEDYTIKAGDSLDVLARRFGTTQELIAKSNNIRGSLIREGDRIRILQGTFSIEVDKSSNELRVSLNNRLFKRYRVGTGQHDKTPAGSFYITDRIMHPTWWRPDGRPIPYGDKENVLGTHWLSLDLKGYGIHGTWEPETIGRSESAGCIRLLNEDIEELYTLIPVGTRVEIKD
jgi:lipoprotein-anchoring transpeptidase ErfK/SrfK